MSGGRDRHRSEHDTADSEQHDRSQIAAERLPAHPKRRVIDQRGQHYQQYQVRRQLDTRYAGNDRQQCSGNDQQNWARNIDAARREIDDRCDRKHSGADIEIGLHRRKVTERLPTLHSTEHGTRIEHGAKPARSAVREPVIPYIGLAELRLLWAGSPNCATVRLLQAQRQEGVDSDSSLASNAAVGRSTLRAGGCHLLDDWRASSFRVNRPSAPETLTGRFRQLLSFARPNSNVGS